MQKLHYLKLLSKTSRNLSNSSNATASVRPKPSLFHPNSKNPSHPNEFFSQYPPWSSPNGVSGGFCLNPSIRKLLPRSTLVTAQSYALFHGTVKGLRAQFLRRNFHSNYSFGSNRRTRFQQLTTNGVVLGLIVTNVAVFLLWRIADHSFMMKNFTISLGNIQSGRIHTMITSAFSHMDTGHLISNMVGLYFFGTSLGRVFGPEFLLKLYFAGAVGGSVFYLVHHGFLALSSKRKQMWTFDSSRVPALGASGAVNAIMLLDIFLFPTKTLYLDFIIPIPAILLGIFLIGQDMRRILEGDSQISGSAHLGGATVAAVAWALVRRGRIRF